MAAENQFIIFGSGMSGLLCGLHLQREGLPVVILETNPKGFINPGWISTIDRGIFLRYLHRAPYPTELATETKVNHIVSPRGTKTFTLKSEKLYHLHFHIFYENLKREFLELGGKIHYKIDYGKVRLERTDGLWTVIYPAFPFKKTWRTKLLIDASGIYSPFRSRFALEGDSLEISPSWICRAQYGEYRINDTDWRRPPEGERYSLVLRHNSYSLQQYHHDSRNDILKTQVGIIRQKKGSMPVTTVSLKAELFQYLRIANYETVTEQFRDIPIRHSALALQGEGYLMVGDTAFLTDSQRASGMGSAIASAQLAAKTVQYIQKNRLSYNFHNLHSYTHEYMMSRGMKLLQIHGLVRLALNFDRSELDLLFQRGFIGLSNIETVFEPEQMLSGRSYFFQKLFPVLRNLAFSAKIAKAMQPYFEYRKHLDSYPYFPDKEEMKRYALKTSELLNAIYNPDE